MRKFSGRLVSATLVASVCGVMLVAAPGTASAATPATTAGIGKKCYSYEEGDTKYSQGDEWVCVRIGKSWQRKFMWVVYE
jgi:hypothetical protein